MHACMCAAARECTHVQRPTCSTHALGCHARCPADAYHYVPVYLRPKAVVTAAVAFVVACNCLPPFLASKGHLTLTSIDHVRVTFMAATPMSIILFLWLWVMPRKFQAYATEASVGEWGQQHVAR